MQPCFVEPKQLADDLWAHPPWGKRPWPSVCFESRNKQLFPPSPCIPSLIATPSYPLPSPTFSLPPTFSSFQERSVKKHGILQRSLQLWRREEGKKLYHPVGLIEDISEALGVRHSSSSFLHWRLYKQVSNAPDLVWQTFSKEHLKRGWENDTPTFFIYFYFFLGASRIRSPLILFCFSITAISLSHTFLCLFFFTLTGLLWSPRLHKKWQ